MSEPSTKNSDERFVEPSKVELATGENVPTLGVALLVAVCWTLWKLVMSES